MVHLERMKPKRGLDGTSIKYVMAILMIIDHLAIIPNFYTDDVAAWAHIATRMVAPWFAFAAVEGFLYSSNRLRYLFRLIFSGLIMSYGSQLLNLWLFSDSNQVINNIFFSLALGVFCLLLLYPDKERLKVELAEVLPSLNTEKLLRVPDWILNLSVIPLIILVSPQVEGQFLVPLVMVFLYFARTSNKSRSIVMLGMSALYFALYYLNYGKEFFSWPLFGYLSQWFMFSVIPFFYLYNGEVGKKSTFNRYFLYVFYIAHLWIIHGISEFVIQAGLK